MANENIFERYGFGKNDEELIESIKNAIAQHNEDEDLPQEEASNKKLFKMIK